MFNFGYWTSDIEYTYEYDDPRFLKKYDLRGRINDAYKAVLEHYNLRGKIHWAKDGSEKYKMFIEGLDGKIYDSIFNARDIDDYLMQNKKVNIDMRLLIYQRLLEQARWLLTKSNSQSVMNGEKDFNGELVETISNDLTEIYREINIAIYGNDDEFEEEDNGWNL